jgi:uncharacterized protein YbjT (DUF2867 family)
MKPLILVTGATGYVVSQSLIALLAAAVWVARSFTWAGWIAAAAGPARSVETQPPGVEVPHFAFFDTQLSSAVQPASVQVPAGHTSNL